jgi:hypothetical protein
MAAATISPSWSGITWSSSPCTTRAGHLTRDNSDTVPAWSVATKVASWIRMSVSPSVSPPHSTQSSIGLVECGSLNTWPKKKLRKSGYRSRHTWAE